VRCAGYSSICLVPYHGRRPVYGATEKFQSDHHWRDYVLFYEYFHGDNGAGIGASHQTGWTGLVGLLIDAVGRPDPVRFLTEGKASAFAREEASGMPSPHNRF